MTKLFLLAVFALAVEATPVRKVQMIRPALIVGVPSGRTLNTESTPASQPRPTYRKGAVRITGGAVLR